MDAVLTDNGRVSGFFRTSLAVLVIGLAAVPADAGSLRDDVERALTAATVLVGDACTGVVANGPDLVFTAAHCVRDRRSVELGFSDGTTRTGWVAVVDRVADQALLLLEEPVAIAPLRLAPRRPIAGALLYFRGHPGANRFREVKLLRVARVPTLPLLQNALHTTIVGAPGDAGAPIVDGAARVVGLAHGGAWPNVGTPVASLRRLLAKLVRDEPLPMPAAAQ